MSNTKSEDTQLSPFGVQEKCCKIVVDKACTFVWGNCFNAKTKYTMQAWIKADSDKTINISVGNITSDVNVVDEWEQVIQTYDVQSLTSNSIYFNLPIGTYWFFNCKLEKGTRNTDYSTGDDDFFTEIHSAVEIANGKSKCIYSNVAPAGGSYNVGDTWFDTLHGYAINRWNGTEWVLSKLGTDAIAELSITNALIQDATISDAKISNVDAGKITTGYLVADRIANNLIVTRMVNAGAITVDKLAADSVTADKIHVQTITADKLVLKSITSAQIASKTITGNEVQANSITAAELNVATLSAISANIGTVTAGIIKSPNYVANVSGTKIDIAAGSWDSKYVKITESGGLIGTYGSIAGINMNSSGLGVTSYVTFGPFTQADLNTAGQLSASGTWTAQQLLKYDVNGDAKIDTKDVMIMQGMIDGLYNYKQKTSVNIYNNSANTNVISLRRYAYGDNQSPICTSIGAGCIITQTIGFAYNENSGVGYIGLDDGQDIVYHAPEHDFIGDANFDSLTVYGTFYNNSARKYKENIKEITEEEANRILDTKFVSYTKKAETDKTLNYGVIADDMTNVYGNLVGYKNNEVESFNYIGLIPVYGKLLQMMQKEIDELKQKVSQKG